MAIVALLLGVVVIFAVLTYYLLLLMLMALAVALLTITGISIVVSQQFGAGAGLVTGLALFGGLVALYYAWAHRQDEPKTPGSAGELARRRCEAHWRAAQAEQERKAAARPRVEPPARGWRRYWFD